MCVFQYGQNHYKGISVVLVLRLELKVPLVHVFIFCYSILKLNQPIFDSKAKLKCSQQHLCKTLYVTSC